MRISRGLYSKAKKLCSKKRRLLSRDELVRKLSIPESTARGIRAIIENEYLFIKPVVIVETPNTDRITVGVSGDTHIGSKSCDESSLISYLHELNRRGIKILFISGDIIDGINVYRGQSLEVTSVSIDDQLNRANEIIKEFDGEIYYILGNHDRSVFSRTGIDIGDMLKSDTFHYIGDTRGRVVLDGIDIELFHGMGGGGMAVSNKLQRAIDSFSSNKPRYLFAGHWHTHVYLPLYKGVSALTVGCFQGATNLTQRLHINTSVGGWVFNIEHAGDKVISESAEFLSY